MAKSKEKKKAPKPPENAATVVEIRKTIEDRKSKLAKHKAAATKEGKLNRLDAKYRLAIKRLKRAQRKLASEAVRLTPKHQAPAAAAPAAPAGAAPAAEKPAEPAK